MFLNAVGDIDSRDFRKFGCKLESCLCVAFDLAISVILVPSFSYSNTRGFGMFIQQC